MPAWPERSARRTQTLVPNSTRLGPGNIPAEYFLVRAGYRRGIPGNASASRARCVSAPAKARAHPRASTCVPAYPWPATICHAWKPAATPPATAAAPGMLCVNPPCEKTKRRGSRSENLLWRMSLSGSIAPSTAKRSKSPGNGPWNRKIPTSPWVMLSTISPAASQRECASARGRGAVGRVRRFTCPAA
ncbi:MAG: hypothetical protein A4E39_00049 [Methanoregulaceae archaeon PtaB.Bin152]|nr:MAG: hypothetical protein A4E39_00049 [Methanoregulaceae archaeon PtaB.Bin152]